jgi:ketosteroid isomerase-like protein
MSSLCPVRVFVRQQPSGRVIHAGIGQTQTLPERYYLPRVGRIHSTPDWRNATNSVKPAAPGAEAAQGWVSAFAEGWWAPRSADAFADHFEPWLHPYVRLIQPGMPVVVGYQAFRERFARPLFALIPDLRGQVERSAVDADCAYVELTLRGTLGGRPVAWRACDRVTLRDGVVVERESYFDPHRCCGPSSPAPGRGRCSPASGPGSCFGEPRTGNGTTA